LDNPTLRLAAERDPALFLENLGRPALLDEIQNAPGLLPHIKMAVDRNRGAMGQYILTGSQVFALMAGVSESLAGRAALFELLGFSWEEFPGAPPKSVTECFHRLWKGFYPDPALHGVPPKTYYAGYVATYLERDIRQIRSVHDLSRFQAFLELLASRTGSLLNLQEVGRDCGISHTTAQQWLSLLESTRIVYVLRPFFKNLRRRVVKHPKVYFSDTGLLAYLLKYPNSETLRAGPMAGAFFENMVIMEIIKRRLNHGLSFEPYFFRDSNGNEVDLVLDKAGAPILLEIKMSKTPRPEVANVFQRLEGVFKGSQAIVLSLAEEECALSRHVRLMPWWKFDPAVL
jgi:predicted AAA+ superfamily ATPase